MEILVLLASAPDSPSGKQALAFAQSMTAEGHALTLCCRQDAAAWGAGRADDPTRSFVHRLEAAGVRCVALGADLELRGLRAARGVSVVDYAGLVTLLAAEHDRVIGAF